MSADILRRAAALLRERASDASPGPWTAELCGGGHTRCKGGHANGVWSKGALDDVFRDEVTTSSEDAIFIATMHPSVGLALADWLALCASTDSRPPRVWKAAIAVARLILGEAS